MKGIVVCVGYDDLLRITLIRNMRHLTECLVITDPNDVKTREIVADVPSARCYVTDAFYQDGAKFNKGAAIEEGFDVLGREGKILIWDADILLPSVLQLPVLDRDTLYGAPRRILNDPKQWTPDFNWKKAEPNVDPSYPGYFQLFNSQADCLSIRPWYDVSFNHAGGGDARFMLKFKNRVKLPFEVLHLGPFSTNWYGRVSQRADDEPIQATEEEIKERETEMNKIKALVGKGVLPWENGFKDLPGFKSFPV